METNSSRNQTWNLKVTRPSPSMSQDKIVFDANSYAEAVKACHAEFMRTRRPVVLCDGEFGMYFWHRVDANGVATDRNTNSGVPSVQQLEAK